MWLENIKDIPQMVVSLMVMNPMLEFIKQSVNIFQQSLQDGPPHVTSGVITLEVGLYPHLPIL